MRVKNTVSYTGGRCVIGWGFIVCTSTNITVFVIDATCSGHVVGKDNVKVDPEKMQELHEVPRLQGATDASQLVWQTQPPGL